jgi:hypothetical protein
MGSTKRPAHYLVAVALILCAPFILVSGADEKAKTEFKAALADAVVRSS